MGKCYMKRKLLLLLLALCIATLSVLFTGCDNISIYIIEKTPDLNFRTPTPVGLARTLFVWWEQDAENLTLLHDAWYDFAVHLATAKNLVTDRHYVYDYCRNNNSIPALQKAARTAEIWNEDGMDGAFWRINVEQLELSKYIPDVSCWSEIEAELNIAVTAVLNGEQMPKEALDIAAERVNRLLAE